MGEFKDINDRIFYDLLDRLEELGYENITTKAHNEIVDLIDAHCTVEGLIPEAIEIIKKYK
ncbi:MAG TPA: hypothetical protein DCR69_12390 [Clostridium sp.]|nr:hypothetical protein [Clostridium sp.]